MLLQPRPKRLGPQVLSHSLRVPFRHHLAADGPFLRLPRSALVDLSQEIDMEGRVVAGEDLEWGGMNSRYGDGSHIGRKESIGSNQTQMVESDADDDEGMELN